MIGAPFLRVLVDRAFKVMSVCKETPPSTKWAVLKLWLNGWPTHRRFHRVRPCCLCGVGEDSIEHYCKCSVVLTVANTRLGLGFVVGEPLHFLILGVVHADRDMVMRRCAFVQAVYNCTNRCRIQGLGGARPWGVTLDSGQVVVLSAPATEGLPGSVGGPMTGSVVHRLFSLRPSLLFHRDYTVQRSKPLLPHSLS